MYVTLFVDYVAICYHVVVLLWKNYYHIIANVHVLYIASPYDGIVFRKGLSHVDDSHLNKNFPFMTLIRRTYVMTACTTFIYHSSPYRDMMMLYLCFFII